MPALAAYDGQDLLVHLSFSPGRAGQNELGVWLTNYDGSPYQGDAPSLVRLAFSNIELASAPVLVDATSTGDGRWAVAGTQLSISGWWTIEIALRWAGQEDVIVPFHLLLPDPNLNGLEAPPVDLPADPAAEAEYLDAMALYTSVHRVRYSQVMSSHRGSTSYAVHVVNDGADGSVAGFTLDVHGGWHYVVLGESVWSQRPGEAWETSDGGNMTPPSEWDDEYVGATGFRFGRTETVNGELSRTILFAVPGTSKQVVACYVWWVGVESGRLNREMMISQSHYMLSEFSEYDAPAPINPPAIE
jgi:hypothetical protein